ncbi:ankyrin repeat-containing domain protein [Mycena rebaudengoi]|nr:ankyrin repeat-containing domain protein [Mycena rebaudengoi]
MDPVTAVGLVASILQFVVAAKSVIDLGRDVVNAPKEQRALFREVQNLEPLLTDLQRRLLLPGSESINGLQQLKDPLLDFKETMDRIAGRLRSVNESGSKLPKALSWTLWNKNEAEADMAKIERFVTLLNVWLGLDIWDQQQRHHEKLEQMFTNIGNAQRLDHYRLFTEVRNVAQNQQDLQDSAEREKIVKEREKIIEWLSPPNFFARHAEIFGTRQKGTGLWFLRERQFRDWLSSGGTLWCRGIPGAGKTVLTSIVVDYLRNELLGNNTGVAAAYLNHKESDAQSPSNVLAGLWWQLVAERPISPVVQQLYRKHQNRHTRPSLDEVREIFRSTVTEYSRVFVVVDALDEYPEAHRDILLKSLAAMGESVSLMLTSRPNIYPESFLPTTPVVEVRAQEEDIRRYIGAQIQNSFRLSRHVKAKPELHQDIETKIAENADGMFLIAKLHIDSLATKSTVKAVRDALQNLPEDLEHTYNEAMDRINAQNKDDREIARRALIWVANAKRPLTVSELQEALAIEPDSKALDVDGLLDIEIILSVCAGLVIVDAPQWFDTDPGLRIIRLVHLTIQDYLDRVQPIRFPGAQTEIARQCLTYVSYNSVPENNSLQPGLLSYASAYCLLHAAGEPELLLRDSIIQFLGNAHRWPPRHRLSPDLAPQWYHRWPSAPSKLWVAALFGLQHIVRLLLKSDKSISEEEKEESLKVASQWNCLGVVQLLVKHGTDVDATGAAMRAAIEKGHAEVVRLLLEHGADADLQRGRYGSALQEASVRGDKRIVQVLLEHGADVNAQGGEYGTALQAASATGYLELVQLLLENSADVSVQGGKYGTALQAASVQGCMKLVQLLLEHGADSNAQGGEYGTALQAASWGGYMKVAQMLLVVGADVNLQGGIYGTALQAASAAWERQEGAVVLVQLLLEHGADVNVQGGEYGTALQAASWYGRLEIVRLLLEHRADVNLQGGKYGTALQAASAAPWEGVVRLLLKYGADVNMQGGYFGTALQAASWIRSSKVVQLLLENGADVHLHGGIYGTAYHAAKSSIASRPDAHKVVELLIAYGADTDLGVASGS